MDQLGGFEQATHPCELDDYSVGCFPLDDLQEGVGACNCLIDHDWNT